MLQAYVDDSTESNSVMVLAGYIATMEQWLSLTERWQEALSAEPALKTFKMNQLKASAHLERVESFYRIIEECVGAGFYIAIPLRPHRKLCEELHIISKYRSPYYLAWTLLISIFRKLHKDAGLNENIDLIFDNQKEEQFVTDAWHVLKARQNSDMAPFKSAPSFRSDHDVLALQPADLLAWWARKNWLKHGTFKNEEWLFPWEDKSKPVPLPYLHAEMDEEKIKTHFEKNLVPLNVRHPHRGGRKKGGL